MLSHVVSGKIPADIVLEVLWFKLPRALDVVLPLVSLIAVMLVFGRMHQDHEIVIMQSCGMAPRVFQWSITVFLIPLTLLFLWIMLVVVPQSYQSERALVNESKSKGGYADIEAGQFTALPNQKGVIYAKQVDDKGGLHSVWVKYHSSNQSDLILIAQKGAFVRQGDQAILRLENGWRYQNVGKLSNPASDVSQDAVIEVQQFEFFEGVLPQKPSAESGVRFAEFSFMQLWHSDNPEHQALLHLRMVTPLGLLVLALIGLRLSQTGPRQGRFAKLFVALLVFVIYNQLLLTASEKVEDGMSPLALWFVPLVFLLWGLEFDRLLAKVFKPQNKPVSVTSAGEQR